jgi:hypothetical protein
MNVIQDCMVFAAANTGAGKLSKEFLLIFFCCRLGSTMFTGISRLLKFLKKSFQIQSSRNKNNNQDEHQFQTAVINGIGTKISKKEKKNKINLSSRRFF